VVSIFGVRTPLQLTDLPVAVLLLLAMSSLGVRGIVLAGWSARSPCPLLGAMRSCAQVVSYAIALGLSFIAVFLYAGSLSTTAIVNAQASGAPFHLLGLVWHWPSWYAVVLFPSFVVYLFTIVAEASRLPFDLPGGEGGDRRRLPHRICLAEIRHTPASRIRTRPWMLAPWRARPYHVPRRDQTAASGRTAARQGSGHEPGQAKREPLRLGRGERESQGQQPGGAIAGAAAPCRRVPR
jgi:hypothetical protein